MNKQRLLYAALLLPLGYSVALNTKCPGPTNYQSSNYFTVYLTTPEKTSDNFYLVLTKNKHNLYGGQCHVREHHEPLIRFARNTGSKNKLQPTQALVHYHDFIDAINSDQPAHNVRVQSGDQYIILSKLFVREFRNGLAGRTLNTIVSSGLPAKKSAHKH